MQLLLTALCWLRVICLHLPMCVGSALAEGSAKNESCDNGCMLLSCLCCTAAAACRTGEHACGCTIVAMAESHA
jgi:hypothetical protein